MNAPRIPGNEGPFQDFLVSDDATLCILQGVGQAAGLRTITAIGAASGMCVADVALTGIGHAQRAVDEDLHRQRGLFGDSRNLSDR